MFRHTTIWCQIRRMMCTKDMRRHLQHCMEMAITVIQLQYTSVQTLMSRTFFYQQLQQQLVEVPNANLLLLMDHYNTKLACEAQLWGDTIGRFGLPASATDNGTRLLHVCMANNHVVTDTMFQHKSVHLQTWYHLNATDSTRRQNDHVLFRSCDIKAVRHIRVFRGADIESDHRLMVCKLQLHFRKPAKHTFNPRLQSASLHSETGKKAFQLSLQGLLATHHHLPIGDVEHSWGALKSSLNTTAQAQLKQFQGHRDHGSQRQTLHLANCKRKLWQAPQYKAASHEAHKSACADYHHHFSQRCNTPCARATHTPCPQAAQQDQMSTWQAAATWNLWQAASYSFWAHR